MHFRLLHFNFTVRNGTRWRRVSRMFWLCVCLTAWSFDLIYATTKNKGNYSGPPGNDVAKLGQHTVSIRQSKVRFIWKSPIIVKGQFWGRLAAGGGGGGVRQQHCVPEVLKACVVLAWQKRTERWLRGNTFYPTDEPLKRHRKRRNFHKIAPPGATVTEGQRPALTHWALLHSPHAISVKWDRQDDPHSAALCWEDDG